MKGAVDMSILDILARSPPVILFLLGALMMLTGSAIDTQVLITWGQKFLSWGVLLQIFWLIIIFRK